MPVTAGTSYVNSNSANQSSGSVTMTTVDANSVVIVTVATDDAGTANVISPPTATGLTFVQISTTLRSANNFNLAVFRAYTSSALGSTLISCSWTQSNDWVMGATDYTGTAGTSGNNGSDAIGNSNSSITPATASSATVTVTSSGNNNSKYLGAYVVGNTANGSIVKGANYTNNVPSTFDSTFVTLLTELSTNPVSPAANTAVNGTNASASGTPTAGIYGVEILVASSSTVAGWPNPEWSSSTVGPSYGI